MRRRSILILSLLALLSCSLHAQLDRFQVKYLSSYKVHNLNTGLYYATIQEAINANETLAGHTIELDACVFWEHIVVNKSVELCGVINLEVPDGMTAINGNGTGTIVTVKADNVTMNSIKILNGTNGIILDESENTLLSWLRIYNNTENGLYLHNSRNCTLQYCYIKNNHYGVWLIDSESNTICSNSIANNDLGVYHEYSLNNSILENQITNNGDGIVFSSSSNNTISGNQITNNVYGVYFSMSTYNILSANSIADSSQVAITFYNSFNNTIVGNNVTNNNVGINLNAYSIGNKFYHNNFLNNIEQVFIYESTPLIANSWDDGYPSGGNYWSDYQERYPNATEINDSGLWNTPYFIDENNQDNYPIVPEFPSFSILSLFMMTMLLAVVFYKKEAQHNH